MPQLTILQIADLRITDAALDHVGRLRNLEVLHLTSTAMTGTRLRGLEPLSKLRELVFHGLPIEIVAGLPAFPNLEHLGLEYSRVTDEELKLDAERLQWLKNLPKLQALSFSNSTVSSHHLAHVAAVPTLRVLNLNETSLSDEALPRLKELKQLTFLSLAETLLTTEGVASLRAALPGCQVEWSAGDPHQLLAIWLLRHGGNLDVLVGEEIKPIRGLDDLPPPPFQIRHFYPGPQTTDDDLQFFANVRLDSIKSVWLEGLP
jgi:hypothetical protein